MDNPKPLRRRRRLPLFLTDSQVLEVRQRWGAGEAKKALAADYGVDPSTISRIVNATRRVEPLEGEQP